MHPYLVCRSFVCQWKGNTYDEHVGPLEIEVVGELFQEDSPVSPQLMAISRQSQGDFVQTQHGLSVLNHWNRLLLGFRVKADHNAV